MYSHRLASIKFSAKSGPAKALRPQLDGLLQNSMGDPLLSFSRKRAKGMGEKQSRLFAMRFLFRRDVLVDDRLDGAVLDQLVQCLVHRSLQGAFPFSRQMA
ncbi:MAG: hypothetical protein V8S89_05340 [Oscillospiraceae bacterium]